jgi:dihydroxy-acid dehydratase
MPRTGSCLRRARGSGARIDDPVLEISADDVIILRGEGPRRSIGMAGTGLTRIPERLVSVGVKDMVPITDWRMGGQLAAARLLFTSVRSPRSAALSLVETGDIIVLDVLAWVLRAELSESELDARRHSVDRLPYSTAPPMRGFGRLNAESVLHIITGCNFAFLVPPTPEA